MKVLIHVSTVVPFSTLSLYNDTDFREEVSKLIVCSFHNSNCNYFKKDLSLVVYIYSFIFISCIFIICKPYGNHKAKTYTKYKKDKERNMSILTKKYIKSQRKRAREEGNRKELQKQPEKDKMAISTYLSIITLNVSGLNYPIRRRRVAEWVKKTRPCVSFPQDTHIRC